MYPHNNNHSNTDTVQLEAPDYDPDINCNNNNTHHNPTCIMVSTNATAEYEQNIPKLLDASSSKPDTTQFNDNLHETNWPDAPTIQIPSVSSMTVDALPEVVYHCRTTVCMVDRQEVPEIEEDDEHEYNNNNHHLITHHNTHQESERNRREYSTKLQDLDNQQYYDKVDRTPELQYSLPTTPYNTPEQKNTPTTHHQTTLKSNKELCQLFSRG